ncbi:nif-specific transcriptional activator NifA [Blastochloris sulfoviridis]|uniref:Nif-specific regulatory protein n=1 Tax=Blastochloris sulfoviridis TaxID=50712 RepID=A0A5M6I1J5_9HYPH|nr:nif-specific transcriptional activator NifA [Blastochloris sulfoviridis]KAA5602053.1 nif-specific transcriptional activator NifA [Blastochloris sulfoviridis]
MNHGPLDVLVPTSHATAGASVPFSEIALTGVYEISKILASPNRLETTLSNVMGLLWSFMQMRHGIISLLADDGVPDIVVGAGWSEGSDARYRARLPELAVGQIIATGVPLVAQNIAGHPLFSEADIAAMQGGDDASTVSFIGVPIRIGAKVVGTLTIDRIWDGKAVFRFDVDVRFLTMVANLIGQTVQLHRVVARDRDRLIAETHRLQKQLSEFKVPPDSGKPVKVGGIVGDSPAIRSVLRKIEIVAKSHSPVLLRGESGTGKELFARAIHEMSPRADGPFIKVNCAALPESVLESELFGHEKGAFTGALNARKGRFELADKGTFFLDEIGEISPAFQAKLLRVLQESEFERVGGTKTIKVDVRIVTATNRNLEEAVARNDFRADLYYRISVVPLLLPPLRERKTDIPLLAAAFLERFNAENDRKLTFAPGALQVLSNCYFPGNVRELENCVQRTATLAHGPVITHDDFACRLDQCLSSVLWKGQAAASGNRPLPEIPLPVAPQTHTHPRAPVAEAEPPPPVRDEPLPDAYPLDGHRGAAERERLLDAMERSGWVQAKAARILGITPRQIGYALKKHGIPIKRF